MITTGRNAVWFLWIEEQHIAWPDRNGDTQPGKGEISHNVLVQGITNLHMDGRTAVCEVFVSVLVKIDINARCKCTIHSG